MTLSSLAWSAQQVFVPRIEAASRWVQKDAGVKRSINSL
jgi:hypothetical protein